MCPPDQRAPAQPHPEEDQPENELAADQNDSESVFGGREANSDTTSISSLYKGYFENGRRDQNISGENCLMPTDEKQWLSREAGPLLFLVLDSQRSNTLFRSPISPKAQHSIDIGTGSGEWAIDIADKYPNITVRAVDLYPPPQPWTAPNCIYEVDDVKKSWTWSSKFDFAHLRNMLGAVNVSDYNKLYRRIYDNLEPGGWIEQAEPDIDTYCDDGTLPADSLLTKWGSMFKSIAQNADRPLDTCFEMRSRIEAARFINMHQQDYKCPIGTWSRLPVYKDASMEGRIRAAGFTNVQRQEYKTPIGTWPKLPVYKDSGRVSKQQFFDGIRLVHVLVDKVGPA